MKFFSLGVILGIFLANISDAAKIREVYPGKLLRKELIAVHSNPFIEAEFIGKKEDEFAFEFKQYDRQVFEEKPIYEKLIIIREKNDFNDPGIRQVLPGEFIEGEIEKREEIKEIGFIKSEKFHYFGVSTRTDREGILIDQYQIILSQFENLRNSSCNIKFVSKNHGSLNFELTRKELYKKIGIHYEVKGKSYPENLRFEANWDKSEYRAGEIAKLRLAVKNSSTKNKVLRVLARSMSRWNWLEGKMYYIGDLNPGETKTLTRLFRIPRLIEEGNYYFRIGFNEHSGDKPQLSKVIAINNR